MDDLVAFLNARLDEDEAAALAAAKADGKYGGRSHWSARFGAMVTDEADPDWAVVDLSAYVDDADLGEHIARHDPARVLREVEAKRMILARYEDCLARMEDPDYSAVTARGQAIEYQDFVLPNLAAVYSGHPDYRPEWKP